MPLAAELQDCLSEFIASGIVELRENGGHIAPLAGVSWEVRGASEKPLLHLWSERCNLTRRVLAITDHSEHRLALAVERFGRSKPDRLEFIRMDFARSARELSREEFCATLKNILAAQFPDESLESLTVSADLEHSLSSNYARGLMRKGSSLTAVLAVPDGELADACENSLTFALIWLDRCRQSARRGSVSALRIIVPNKMSRAVAHRIASLDPHLPIELFESDPAQETLKKIDRASITNLVTWLVPHRESQALLDQARAVLDPIVALAPKTIAVHPLTQSREVLLRFRGMTFAIWKDGRAFFDAADRREELTNDSLPNLKRLLYELEIHRHPLSSNTRHPFFRAQAERWLESIVREDVTRIDAVLDPRFVYSQVFANTGGERGILDLLTITRTGRLAILELKVTENLHLPMQAADYWLRIRRHLDQNDFSRNGYFPGIQLQQIPPLVYLVAPALRFHPTLDVVPRFFVPELELIRVGVAESWRSGIRVVMRH
jgi:hypothetical protein